MQRSPSPNAREKFVYAYFKNIFKTSGNLAIFYDFFTTLKLQEGSGQLSLIPTFKKKNTNLEQFEKNWKKFKQQRNRSQLKKIKFIRFKSFPQLEKLIILNKIKLENFEDSSAPCALEFKFLTKTDLIVKDVFARL